MLEIFFSLNWINVFLALFLYSFLGFIWFTILFKKQYRISLGKENDTEPPLAMIFVLGPMLCTLVIIITTAILFSRLEIEKSTDALVWGSFIGIGFLSANTFNIAINPNIPKPILYGAISSAYHLVGINVASLLLVQKF
ncbi:DUF1761 domain-containing protein [Leptospira sp. 2 VSF19]|uniref:DUF1761 domain-containing protein n=1 Tax=Leptospira soteropolitanensis TaxID=2950025 RepID=A0AAW5VF02_9LEPT|nr:DUF1761 domain-containing protein [Leptospira soteropolitanensis]MCW7491097.1 DUF1761 domain-containing protein [Leptospira soteropolitanensis]MCW7498681.1 DUF1761 domain-containing protein [Leptospira soteropolitanensis]MCW7521726.1 DUF1761 domain-containing protein [Leptospira soteropolitanensis]MCW7524785.1 DUF1761 domain-containing protein [Leptospira soteropolitanensis]MCW7528652.1 DUF1761 domain-containing protein [Leptospira soteropolitanensis]